MTCEYQSPDTNTHGIQCKCHLAIKRLKDRDYPEGGIEVIKELRQLLCESDQGDQAGECIAYDDFETNGSSSTWAK